jgi:uncharacterized protein YuzE
MTTKVTYDESVHALYIQLSEAVVVETVELSKYVYLDVDADARPVGVEILNADPAFAGAFSGGIEALDLGELLKPRAA